MLAGIALVGTDFNVTELVLTGTDLLKTVFKVMELLEAVLVATWPML